MIPEQFHSLIVSCRFGAGCGFDLKNTSDVLVILPPEVSSYLWSSP
jgi:outer membrane lipopolysaccharide assembly protein LptE/RlpB